MKEKIVPNCLYEDLGFPILLLNVPMKQIFGEWVLDIDLNKLQARALRALVHKPISLNGQELRFIRKYFEMTTTEFGKMFGVTHVGVLKWENDQTKINPATEMYIRLFVLDHLKVKDREFRQLFHEISIENLKKRNKDESGLMEIDAQEQLLNAS